MTCSGTPTGAALTYDAERRLATWQNMPSNPTSTASYWYDGEGHRVAQTYNGTTTYYVGDDEEITGATLLKYYHIPNLPELGTIVGVTRTYLASDGLGSETVDLSYNGSVLATALYGPYGVGRYATGTMPSSKGYTGQRQDSGSGLDYYSARYYDPTIGRFVSADVWQGPDRYGYVGGNPETATDPTGYMRVGDPSGGDPGPQTDRPNYYKLYMQYYWNDDSAGSGNFGVADFLLSGGKMDPEEFIDGVALADYFGLTVIRPRRQEKRGVGEPDYLVGIKGNLDPLPGALFLPELNVSWLDVIGALKGSDTLHFPTAVELYTPQSGSADDPGAWENRRSPYGGPGILKEVYAKGRAQASIIAIDISNIDDTGKMSKDDLIAYANTAFNWPYEPKDKPSMVERVIFIRDGQVILDVQSDPYNPFGPPARTDAPPRPPVLA